MNRTSIYSNNPTYAKQQATVSTRAGEKLGQKLVTTVKRMSGNFAKNNTVNGDSFTKSSGIVTRSMS